MSRRTHVRIPIAGRAVPPVGSDFVSVEALGGVLLLAATATALLWANLANHSYTDVWDHVLTIGIGRFAISEDLGHWVNDGLMAVFFFVVGIEIKRELVQGELRDRRTASLPVVAAVGGMVIPAVLYLALNAGGPGQDAWAIPMATDIAFAIVVLAILGSRIPSALKLFLLTLAIVDDIGAVLVIAIFYSHGIDIIWLLAALGAVGVIVFMQRLRIRPPVAYIVPAVLLWVCTFESGVHATIAGVALGLLVPVRPVHGREVGAALERTLHPWSSFLVVPVFALANAGIPLDAATFDRALTSSIVWGIVIALVVGKPLGIVLASALALRSGIARLPDDLSLTHVAGAGCVAGIGFTVSLFVADASFSGTTLSEAKLAVLGASLISAIGGCVWLVTTSARARNP
jgi:NhaA family Na+:H+ antiporter